MTTAKGSGSFYSPHGNTCHGRTPGMGMENLTRSVQRQLLVQIRYQ
jgi:hypothetical protein